MIDERRVCEVWADDRSVGTGLLVSERLLLTAWHVARAGAATVRFPALHATQRCRAEVVWSRDDLDVALLRLAEPVRAARLTPVRWGRFVTGRSGIPAETLGFPDAHVAGPDGMRDWAHVAGELQALDRRKSGRIDLAVRSWPERWERRSLWRGVSGAPLVSGGLVCGVVVEDPHAYHSRRLTAVRVEAFFDDPVFAAELAHPILEPAELAPLQQHTPARTSPANLLRADAEVMPFHGREDVLERLCGWRDDEDVQRSVRVLTGSGGQGKTRLAREFARRTAREGWAVLDLREEVVAFESVRDVRERLLIVVDYPEKRRDQLAALVEALPGIRSVRLLMTARTGGDWLTQLTTHCREFRELLPDDVDDAVERLQPLPLDPDLYGRALDAYRSRLQALRPEVDWTAAARRAGTPTLDVSRYGNALTLQMEALGRLLSAADGAPVSTVDNTSMSTVDPAAVVLNHEARYWSRHAATVADLGTRLPGPVLQRVVTVATLCTAREDRAESPLPILRRLPDLRDQPAATMTAVAQWLNDLYGEPGWACAPMRPDPLHESLVARELDATPGLLDGVLPVLTERQSIELLVVLARSAAVSTTVTGALTGLLRRFPTRLARAALVAAGHLDDTARERLLAVLAAAGITQSAGIRLWQQRLSDAVSGLGDLLRPRGRRRDTPLSQAATGRHTGPSLSMVSGSGAAAGSGTSPVRLISDAVTMAVARAARTPFGQLLQQHPDLGRRVAAGVAAVATIPVLLALPGSGSPPVDAAAGPSVAGQKSNGAPMPGSSVPGATRPGEYPANRPGPGDPVGSDPAGAAPGGSAAPAGPGAPPDPGTGAGSSGPAATEPNDGKFDVEVDATALSTAQITIGGATGLVDSRVVHKVRMAPGSYKLSSGSAWHDKKFTVTAAGTVDYDAGVSYFSGRGTPRLTVTGLAITVDARSMSGPTFGVFNVRSNMATGAPQVLRVLPATYALGFHSTWTKESFTVTEAGTVDYPAGATYLGGRGGTTLTVHGVAVTVDATKLTAPTFSVWGVLGAANKNTPVSLRLLPADYRIAAGSTWSTAFFTVTPAGGVTRDAAAAPYLSVGGNTVSITTATLPA
ncbi:hypothetical protein Val02_05140 [Virgisporangium aliadipatigenens]|uniref:Trypsin-like peptidase domain-containing protein n=1 Tax=Virgisporangium aliadipatigenens TaxID=741659 RepID=A0A8J3YGL7_9ACTN|nr:serine protease [Virgisporangium aliadipatigenens]GIJ43628.1 hypothetical protein Val02_05140 [Virgisporangium aliadipatigenens]